jgi:DNA repair exonuclease SbcCD ATPase subunit
MEDYLSKIA